MEIRMDIETEYIEELKKSTGEKKTSKIVAEALALYKWAVSQKKKQKEIYSLKENGEDLERIVLPGLDKVVAG